MTTPAPPDITPYVDLTLLDVDVQTLVERARALLAVIFPGWRPDETRIEAALIEAFALEVAELVYAINRVPGAVLEVALLLFGLARDAGAPATADVTFTTSNVGAITVPAGTRVTLEVGGGLAPLDFRTDTELLVAAGATTATVRATADESTVRANTVAAGTAVELRDAVSYVDAAALTLVTVGRDPEDGRAFLERGVIRLRRLVTTLTLNEHFTAAVLEDVRVSRATTLSKYDPTQPGVPGDHRGHVTVVVAGPGGTALPSADKADLEQTLEVQAHAGLDVHMLDATITYADVTVTVKAKPDTDPVALADAVELTLDAYLDPDVWKFGDVVYRNELIPLVDAVPGVERVVDLVIAGANVDGDLELAGFGPLADLGTATVTVEPA